MKTTTLFVIPFVFIACRKTIPNAQDHSKFNCVCKTSTLYVDHCGKDSSLVSTQVQGTDQQQAAQTCKENDLRTEDSYSITIRECQLN